MRLVVLVGEKSQAALRARERPRLALLAGQRIQARASRNRLLAATQPQVAVHQLGVWGDVDVADAEPIEVVLEALEMPGGEIGVAQSELELAQRAQDPRLIQAHFELAAQRFGLGRVGAAG